MHDLRQMEVVKLTLEDREATTRIQVDELSYSQRALRQQ